MFTIEETREKLRQACRESGGQSAWCQKHGITAPFLSEILRGRRDPTERVVRLIGLERVMMFREAPNSDSK